MGFCLGDEYVLNLIWLHNSMNILKTVELHSLSRCPVRYMSCIPIMMLQKKKIKKLYRLQEKKDDDIDPSCDNRVEINLGVSMHRT